MLTGMQNNADCREMKTKKKNRKAKKKGGKDDIWEIGDEMERERIRLFWTNLGEEERRALVKLEKEAVVKKMKEQQKQTCSCSVCGRRRSDIESQLELLYNTYYQELENFANMQLDSPDVYRKHPHSARYSHHHHHHHHNHNHEEMPPLVDDDEEDYDGVSEDEVYSTESEDSGILEFGTSLTVKGGILTVADDFLKNDGRKFLNLMEHLAQRKIRPTPIEERPYHSGSENGEGWDDYDDEEGSNSDDYEDEELQTSDQQRMEEGRRMFQIFAAKMFEQRVLVAYREKAASDRAAKLLQELDEEENQKKMKEEAKVRKVEKEKERQRLAKEKTEKEKIALEKQKLAEEANRTRQKEEQKQKLVRAAALKEEQRVAEVARAEAKKAEKEKQKERAAKREADEAARKALLAKKQAEQKEKDEKDERDAARKSKLSEEKQKVEAEQFTAKQAMLANQAKTKKLEITKKVKSDESPKKKKSPAEEHTKKLKQRLKSHVKEKDQERVAVNQTDSVLTPNVIKFFAQNKQEVPNHQQQQAQLQQAQQEQAQQQQAQLQQAQLQQAQQLQAQQLQAQQQQAIQQQQHIQQQNVTLQQQQSHTSYAQQQIYSQQTQPIQHHQPIQTPYQPFKEPYTEQPFNDIFKAPIKNIWTNQVGSQDWKDAFANNLPSALFEESEVAGLGKREGLKDVNWGMPVRPSQRNPPPGFHTSYTRPSANTQNFNQPGFSILEPSLPPMNINMDLNMDLKNANLVQQSMLPSWSVKAASGSKYFDSLNTAEYTSK